MISPTEVFRYLSTFSYLSIYLLSSSGKGSIKPLLKGVYLSNYLSTFSYLSIYLFLSVYLPSPIHLSTFSYLSIYLLSSSGKDSIKPLLIGDYLSIYLPSPICLSTFSYLSIYLLSGGGKGSIKPLFKGVASLEDGRQQEVEKGPELR